jgi:ribulose-5-phosphate 4-epimerase/fuculose-1-phosphate aldolase
VRPRAEGVPKESRMDLSEAGRLRPDEIDETEWALRLELAACYRVFHNLGWTESIFNHITLRIPGPEHHYLINPFGLLYSEVTARNLIRVGLDGEPVRPTPHPVNVAGFVIHSAIHRHRDDAHCIMHTHTTAGMAVACKEDGLRTDNFNSAQLHGRVAYHDFEGITTDTAEQPRLVASLGDKDVLILRNHGLLTTGVHLPAAFATMWCLQRACEVQLATDSLRGPNRAIRPEVLEAIPRQARPFRGSGDGSGPRRGQMIFDAAVRAAGVRLVDLA